MSKRVFWGIPRRIPMTDLTVVDAFSIKDVAVKRSNGAKVIKLVEVEEDEPYDLDDPGNSWGEWTDFEQ